MERLTTDNPLGCLQTMLNYAYDKDGNVYLRYGDGEEDINLCEYISRVAKEKGCFYTAQEILDEACTECDCEMAILYCVATQAAKLRARLAAYEDSGLSPDEVGRCGKWERVRDIIQCSACGFGMFDRSCFFMEGQCTHSDMTSYKPHYCPNCGARMEDDDE